MSHSCFMFSSLVKEKNIFIKDTMLLCYVFQLRMPKESEQKLDRIKITMYYQHDYEKI